MEKLQLNYLNDSKYYRIVTVLDYEFRLNNGLRELAFAPSENDSRKIIVDMALKTGIDSFRFIEYDIDRMGKVVLSSYKYVIVDEELESRANSLLREKREILLNSILTDTKKIEILSNL